MLSRESESKHTAPSWTPAVGSVDPQQWSVHKLLAATLHPALPRETAKQEASRSKIICHLAMTEKKSPGPQVPQSRVQLLAQPWRCLPRPYRRSSGKDPVQGSGSGRAGRSLAQTGGVGGQALPPWEPAGKACPAWGLLDPPLPSSGSSSGPAPTPHRPLLLPHPCTARGSRPLLLPVGLGHTDKGEWKYGPESPQIATVAAEATCESPVRMLFPTPSYPQC